MIRFSVNIMRGCFGGCTFCSITEHEGRIIQSRSEDSILREIEEIRDKTPGFTGVISDLGGPTANMYRMACKDPKIEAACRRPSCVYPGICPNLNTDHDAADRPVPQGARDCRASRRCWSPPACATTSRCSRPEYVKELVTHHVGGYLKIAPEHTEDGPAVEDDEAGHRQPTTASSSCSTQSAHEAGKKQYLIPYFIAAHPGTTDEDMLNLALWLKKQRLPRRPGADLPALARWRPPRPCTTRGATRCKASRDARQRRGGRGAAAARSAGCTRRSCAITIRRTGRCCARR